jgi:hypothetical protein
MNCPRMTFSGSGVISSFVESCTRAGCGKGPRQLAKNSWSRPPDLAEVAIVRNP